MHCGDVVGHGAASAVIAAAVAGCFESLKINLDFDVDFGIYEILRHLDRVVTIAGP